MEITITNDLPSLDEIIFADDDDDGGQQLGEPKLWTMCNEYIFDSQRGRGGKGNGYMHNKFTCCR
jgi:hypothetical protein